MDLESMDLESMTGSNANTSYNTSHLNNVELITLIVDSLILFTYTPVSSAPLTVSSKYLSVASAGSYAKNLVMLDLINSRNSPNSPNSMKSVKSVTKSSLADDAFGRDSSGKDGLADNVLERLAELGWALGCFDSLYGSAMGYNNAAGT